MERITGTGLRAPFTSYAGPVPDSGPYQPYPTTGKLAANMNTSLLELIGRLGDADGVTYSYIVDTVEDGEYGFSHSGSGPNWQGDIISLCTCKHHMRTYRSLEAWPGTWIAGLTGADNTNDGRHYLVYLMRVAAAYATQESLWTSLNDQVRVPVPRLPSRASHGVMQRKERRGTNRMRDRR